MHLAVDARVVAQDARGIGRYERAILRRLLARTDVEITLLLPELVPWLRRPALAAALGSSRFRLRSRVPNDADLVWHPANGMFFESSVPNVATIHDAVPFRYPSADERKRNADQQPFLRSAAAARRIVAVSHFGASEIEAVFDVDPARIEVIYHGVDPVFSPGAPEALPAGLRTGAYFLFVGSTDEPRKNFAMLYDAYRRAFPSDGPPIVVVGARAQQAEGVVAVGEFADDRRFAQNHGLRDLYRGAIALAIPSYHETFGMPLIEAMACGTPVIACDATCLPEIGGDAASYLPATDHDAWARELRRFAGDGTLRETFRTRGLERAAQFRWERSTGEHLSLFRRVADGER